MAREVPTNQAGLRQGYQYAPAAYAQVWPLPNALPVGGGALGEARQAPGMRIGQSVPFRLFLLFVAMLFGAAAICASTDWQPAIAALGLGLGEGGPFYLLVGGIYVEAAAVYALLRTRFLTDLRSAPWDAICAAYATMGLGALGLAVAVLAVLALVAAATLAILVVVAVGRTVLAMMSAPADE